MAICMMCHRKVANGVRFCDECNIKMKQQADESYLDSLLNSVSGNAPAAKKAPQPEINYNNYYDESPVQEDYSDNSYEDINAYSASLAEETSEETYPNNTEDMDAMLNDLLADMEESGFGDGSDELPDTEIDPNDLADIFNEAENNVYESNNLPDALESEDSMFNVDSALEEATDSSSGFSAEDFDTEGLGPADIAILNGDENSAVNVDYDMAELPEGVTVDSDMDALFQEVNGSDGLSDINDSEDLNSILGISGDDSELDEVLNDMSMGNFEAPGPEETKDTNPKKDSSKKKEKKNKKSEDSEDKPKKSFWKRLFGNILEKTPEQVEAEEKQAELDAQKKKEKAAENKQKAEEEKARAKAEAEIAKKEKEARKAAEKAAAREKAQKKKEEALALAEFEVEHGRINKAGATILFVIFAILTIIIIIGTNIYSYNLSIENAQKDFDIHKYNEAYYEVYGLKIQDEDIELYDRIMTVMYVNTQLNSFEYYIEAGSREKALDSLLKGLERYDKYLQLATILDIKEDIDYVKNNIVEKLKTEFNLTLEDANSMIDINDSIDYSDSIYALLGSYEEQLNQLTEKE